MTSRLVALALTENLSNFPKEEAACRDDMQTGIAVVYFNRFPG